MANANLMYRKDVVLMVAFDPSAPTTFTNFCGATGCSLQITNEIISEKIGDCSDWSAAIQTVKSYGAQDAKLSINGQYARSNHDKIMRWARDQLTLPVRLHFTDVASGEVEYIDGLALLPDFSVGDIGNVEGQAISRNLSLEISGGLEFTDKA